MGLWLNVYWCSSCATVQRYSRQTFACSPRWGGGGAISNNCVVLEESPCPRGSSTNLQILVLVREAQVLDNNTGYYTLYITLYSGVMMYTCTLQLLAVDHLSGVTCAAAQYARQLRDLRYSAFDCTPASEPRAARAAAATWNWPPSASNL